MIVVSFVLLNVTSVDLKLFAIDYPPKAIAKGIAFGSLSPSIDTDDGIVAAAEPVASSNTVTKAVPLKNLKIIFPDVFVSAKICPAVFTDGAEVPLLFDITADKTLFKSERKEGNP
tara:strand:+ start:1031 stop:1378 length:348 start_codon:yes stop_codon:yes gene_type:complete